MVTLEEVFKANLKRLRGNRTQAEIAESAGIPLRSYQHAESGIVPQGPNRQAIARALGVQETTLFMDPELSGDAALEAENRQLKRLNAAQDQQLHKYAKLIKLLDKLDPSEIGSLEREIEESLTPRSSRNSRRVVK